MITTSKINAKRSVRDTFKVLRSAKTRAVQVTRLNVKNPPSCVSKHARFDKDGGMCEFIKHTQQYDLQKKQEASAIIGGCIVSSTTPSDIQEGTCTLPQQTAKSQQLGSVSRD